MTKNMFLSNIYQPRNTGDTRPPRSTLPIEPPLHLVTSHRSRRIPRIRSFLYRSRAVRNWIGVREKQTFNGECTALCKNRFTGYMISAASDENMFYDQRIAGHVGVVNRLMARMWGRSMVQRPRAFLSVP